MSSIKLAKCQHVNDLPNRDEVKAPFIQRNADGSTEGRDPRKLPRELLETVHEPTPPLRVIRARCMDCCAYQPSEVAKCTAVDCVAWPYRMGTNPFRHQGEPSAAQLEARARMAARWRSGDDTPGNPSGENEPDPDEDLDEATDA
jgi:hypothetical protein